METASSRLRGELWEELAALENVLPDVSRRLHRLIKQFLNADLKERTHCTCHNEPPYHCHNCIEIGFSECQEKAAKIASNHANGGRRLCSDNMHDDRWCSACESMRDEADLLEQGIKALTSEEKK